MCVAHCGQRVRVVGFPQVRHGRRIGVQSHSFLFGGCLRRRGRRRDRRMFLSANLCLSSRVQRDFIVSTLPFGSARCRWMQSLCLPMLLPMFDSVSISVRGVMSRIGCRVRVVL